MQIIQWFKDHWDAILACQQALFIFLSALFELLGKTQISKWFGTYATFDFGRVIRNGKAKATITNGALLIGCSLILGGCGHTQLVAATTSSGHTYQYCLEVTYPVYVAQADALFCGGLEAVTAEAERQKQACPKNIYTIVPAK